MLNKIKKINKNIFLILGIIIFTILISLNSKDNKKDSTPEIFEYEQKENNNNER